MRSDNLVIPIVILAFLYVVSISFFHLVEGWDFLDAAYFTTMTISTVGYGDIRPVTPLGKLGSMLLIFIGISIAFYVITQLGALRERTLDPHIKRRLKTLHQLAALQTGPKGKGELKKIKDKIKGSGSLIKVG